MTAYDELIQFILNLTPEQTKKLLDHPVTKTLMKEYGEKTEKGQAA